MLRSGNLQDDLLYVRHMFKFRMFALPCKPVGGASSNQIKYSSIKMNNVYSVGNAFKHVNCHPAVSTPWTKTTRCPHHLGVKNPGFTLSIDSSKSLLKLVNFMLCLAQNAFAKCIWNTRHLSNISYSHSIPFVHHFDCIIKWT